MQRGSRTLAVVEMPGARIARSRCRSGETRPLQRVVARLFRIIAPRDPVRWPRTSKVAAALCVAIAILGLVPADGFAQSTADEYAEAKQRLDDLQAQANDLAHRYATAYARSAGLAQQIVELDARVGRLGREQRARRRIVAERAVNLYLGGSNLSLDPMLGGSSTMDAARRSVYASFVANRDRRALDELRSAGQDLDTLRGELDTAKSQQDALTDQLQRQTTDLEARLREAQQIRDQLGERLVAEEEAARRAVAAQARARAEARARQARSTTGQSTETEVAGSRPDPIEPSGNDSSGHGVAICPIRGAVAFTDTWGDARPGGRSHQGVDLLSPAGTPNVAVTSGRIEQDYGDRMGNAVFLYGDNGNVYYYFHLSGFEGGPRVVAESEVIGYVGSTGASGANHTHFEIHPGGGGAINPYPAARAAC